MPKYNCGELDQLITIKRETTTDDGLGGTTRSGYEDVHTNIWAKVTPKSGTERQEHDRLRAPASYTFVIHYVNDLLETDVIEWAGVDYHIRFLPDAGNREIYLEIEAERAVNS